MIEPNPPKRRRGCLFYGCLTGIVCMVAFLAAALLGVHAFKKMLLEYTDTKPMALSPLELTQAQIDQVQRRYEAFNSAVADRRPTPPLVLSGDDINALLASQPNFKRFRDNVRVDIEDTHLTGQISLPLDQTGWKMFKGRYLNGSGTFAVWMENGLLYVTPQSITVKGKPIPSVYMGKLRTMNLAQNVDTNNQVSVALNRLQSIQVTNGTLVVTPKEEK